MRYLYIIIFVVTIGTPVSAQFNTLGLVWIADIDVPTSILDLYIEDLDGDGIKEIIISSYNIHIYDGITYEHIWTSPEIDGPYELKFDDLNNDGLVDLAVYKWLFNQGIILIDPHNSQILWTSPPQDTTFKCYAVGDRNGDGWGDVAIVTKELFSRYNVEDNMDTVWIDIYDGPGYNLTDTAIFTFLNYEMNYSNMTFFRWEVPTNVELAALGDSLNPIPMILLFNEIEWGYYGNLPEMFNYYGSVVGINATTLNSEFTGGFGKFVSGNSLILNNTNIYKYYARSIGIDDLSLSLTVKEILLSADSEYYSINLFNDNNPGSPYPPRPPFAMRWLLNDEMNHTNNYGEVAFAYFYPWPECYKIRLYEEISGSYIGSSTFNDPLSGEAFVLSYPSIFSENKIVFRYNIPNGRYYLLDGATGRVDGQINYPSGILAIDDADGNMDDEVYVKNSNYRISVWSLELLSDINEQSPEVFEFGFANYPNPFNTSTIIEFDLPVRCHVRIDIYDLLGRLVETPVNEE